MELLWHRRQGSSPLARGLLRPIVKAQILPRIIPARAGFTACSASLDTTGQDHPRSRGVYTYLPDTNEVWKGSSPLARGLHRMPEIGCRLTGIIPARAGFTMPRRARIATAPDHPRSRGVYPAMNRGADSARGSSPLARGLHPLDEPAALVGRIIPARAGFTPPFGNRSSSDADHPRSRGVY